MKFYKMGIYPENSGNILYYYHSKIKEKFGIPIDYGLWYIELSSKGMQRENPVVLDLLMDQIKYDDIHHPYNAQDHCGIIHSLLKEKHDIRIDGQKALFVYKMFPLNDII